MRNKISTRVTDSCRGHLKNRWGYRSEFVVLSNSILFLQDSFSVGFCYSEQMEKPPHNLEVQPNFIFPDLRYEMGEIERTAKLFASEHVKDFMKKFVEQAQESELIDLTEDIWKDLENTDSFDITKHDWEQVAEYSEFVGRDWQTKRDLIQNGTPVHAPVILKKGNVYHKIAGNTRLMVARALGVVPKVLIVDMTDFE